MVEWFGGFDGARLQDGDEQQGGGDEPGTISYEQLARHLGKPGAARAVAGACAANTLAVAVPCHRVVNVAGELAGYRWGIERKQTLLDREAGAMCAPRIRPTARNVADSTERSA